MKNKQTSIRMLTEGALYTAAYGLLAILTRYLITGTDSFIYYLYPIPLAIYTARNKFKYGLLVYLASIFISFLFANITFVLLLIIPNLIIGLLFGLLEINSKNKIVNYIVIFAVCLAADFLSVYAYELITQTSYWEQDIELVTKIINSFIVIDANTIKQIISITSIVVLILDSVIKMILIYMLFNIIVIRLKLISDYKPSYKVFLTYNPFVTLVYVLLLVAVFFLTNAALSGNIIIKIILILVMSLLSILSFYLLYQFTMYLRLKNLRMKTGIMVILTILSLILFPISIIYALVLNLISWK